MYCRAQGAAREYPLPRRTLGTGMLAIVEEHLQAIRKARSDADILAVLKQITQRFGFRSGYVIEYRSSRQRYEYLIDTDENRASAWAAYFDGPLHDPARTAQTLASVEVMVVTNANFSGPDDPLLKFCMDNDILDSVVVPIQHAGSAVGIVGFSGLGSSDGSERIALQLVCYNLFAQIRSLRNSGPKRVPTRLTAREKEVMRLAADGMTAQQIAETLGMSARTANQHVDNVADKLGTKNRTHTVAEAIRHDLLN